MSMKRVNYVVANWKMNGLKSYQKIFKSVSKHLNSKRSKISKVIVCPPHTLIHSLSLSKKSNIGYKMPRPTDSTMTPKNKKIDKKTSFFKLVF